MRSQKKSWHRYTRPYRQVPRIYDESGRDPSPPTLQTYNSTDNLPKCQISTQHDDQTPKNLGTGHQWPSSGPPILQTYNSMDNSPERQISAQHDDQTSENLATGVQYPSSGLANANYAQMCSYPNHPNPGVRVQTTANRSSLPVGQLRNLEDSEIVDWEPIPPSYELAVLANTHFDAPTMAQLWGYSWCKRLFLRALAQNFVSQPRFSDRLEVPEWIRNGMYTTGIGPKGYETIYCRREKDNHLGLLD